MRRRLAFAAFGVALLVLCTGVTMGLLDALRPSPSSLGPATPTISTTRTPLPEAEAAFTVSGVVIDTDGSPVSGVTIRPYEGQAAVTDVEGRFRIGLDESTYVVPQELSADPRRIAVSEDADDLVFRVPKLCPLSVDVVYEDGLPASALLTLSVYTEGFPFTSNQFVETEGHTIFPLAACGRASLLAFADGMGTAELRWQLTEATAETLVLRQGARVWGTFLDTHGDPVAGATVRTRSRDMAAVVDETGHWELWLESGLSWRLAPNPKRPDLLAETRTVEVPEGAEELRVDFVARPYRLIEVRCAGLPEDSCQTVVPVLCTQPLSPIGELCESHEPTICVCPEGRVAIRGGGQSVEAGPDDEAVWLDFRYGGAIVGRVWRDDEPFRCWYGAARMPEGVDELLGGGTHARTGWCEDDGTFEIIGLDAGRWAVEIYSGDGRWPQDDVVIDKAVVDLGDIDLSDGGEVVVTVYDGLTGEPAPFEAVLANLRGRDSMNPAGNGGMTDADGVAALSGLEDGVYDVFLARRPFERVAVRVSGGDDHEVVLETGEADLLDENGFAVATDSSGALRIADVERDGAAAQNGLAEGDAVVGVVVAGVDLIEWAPQYAEEAARWVLDNYSGPGVDLVVERDDGLHDVPLE